MKITYTGKPEALTPAENRKIEQRFAKLSKLLDSRRGEVEAHVIVAGQRHLQRAEITLQYRDRQIFCESAAADAFTALSDAAEKLEKQILKLRTKTRDTKRGPKEEPEEALVAEAPEPARPQKKAAMAAAARVPARREEEPEPEAEEAPAGPQVHRINHHERRKPMTVDEAMIEIDARDYVVYRDAETNRVAVLIRRSDGDFDLIEA
ncbi:MAG TPA: ribosome-associated translation inhibitor RaiA [Bryobacteraceae bacterium]|nr:ribosome-associated translation inhibitor RaiA [Bryobacteraceae bacterium]